MVTSNAASGYVAEMGMLRLNVGSGMLRLSSCMLTLRRPPPYTVCGPSLRPPWTDEVRLSLSMHELSLSMPEPMLSLSMLILATTSVLSQRDGFRQPYSNFSNRQYPLAQNRGTILMGIAVWRVAEKPKIAIFGPGPKPTF